MKFQIAFLSGMMILGLAGCSQTPEERQEKADEAARQAGRAAYQASQKAKEAAREAEKAAEDLDQKLKVAGDEARKGWDDAKRDRQQQPPKQ